MRAQLFDHVNMPAGAAQLPRGDAPNPEAEAAAYEQAIMDAGDIGLQLLGLGANGHIGFNEPTSPPRLLDAGEDADPIHTRGECPLLR